MEFLDDIRNFLYSGGDVLWLILGIAICLWSLIIERLIFFRINFPGLRASCLERWNQREDKTSTYALFCQLHYS